MLITVIVLQILIGATVIFTELNMYIAMFHQSLAVILFMMLSFLFWFKCNRMATCQSPQSNVDAWEKGPDLGVSESLERTK